MTGDAKNERERRRQAAAERARARSQALPEWPANRARPTFATEAEEVRFLSSYSFADYWAARAKGRGRKKESVLRIRLSEAEREVVKARAKERGVTVSQVLRESIAQLAPPANIVKIEAGAIAPTPDGSVAFVHLRVRNEGGPVTRVRCWITFFRQSLPHVSLFAEEMPARWASAPLPFAPGTNQFDAFLASQGQLADFAPGEEHAVGIMVKFRSGDCFGWTPQSYVPKELRKWALPVEPLLVRARVMAAGRDTFEQFLVDTSASIERLQVEARGEAPRSRVRPSEAQQEVEAFVRGEPNLKLVG